MTAARLGLERRDAEALKFLVHHHLLMNPLVFRRDTSDEQLIVQFAVEVGSPELLEMLYVLTAADLAAVGPGSWNNWKAEVITDLYQRTMDHLAGESVGLNFEDHLALQRKAVRNNLARKAAIPGLPARSRPCRPIISTVRRWSRLPTTCACCVRCRSTT
jgi:[protein-PII] uridylyltransferase